MKIFIDSANLDDIIKCFNTGLVDGVTTNPSLLAKAGMAPDYVYDRLVEMGVPDVSMEVWGTINEMEDEAMRLFTVYKEAATIKLPMTPDGLEVCRRLEEKAIRTNVTLIFNAAQALLAAKSGATYVSPFVGRIDDQGYAGLEVVRSIAALFAQHRVDTEVLAASIRTPHRAVRSFFNGASIATLPPSVFWKMYEHVLTDVGLAIFDKDAEDIQTFPCAV